MRLFQTLQMPGSLRAERIKDQDGIAPGAHSSRQNASGVQSEDEDAEEQAEEEKTSSRLRVVKGEWRLNFCANHCLLQQQQQFPHFSLLLLAFDDERHRRDTNS